jgi:hypothetical protein
MDNRYYSYDCPPLMNDGRFISNYVRSSLFDQYIRNTNNLDSSQDFKDFLQKNGSTILNNIKSYYRKENSCSIGGKCLPISPLEDNSVGFSNNDNIGSWYDSILDEKHHEEMNFMMSFPPSLNQHQPVNNMMQIPFLNITQTPAQSVITHMPVTEAHHMSHNMPLTEAHHMSHDMPVTEAHHMSHDMPVTEAHHMSELPATQCTTCQNLNN